jgi:hypothetical protein
MAHYRGDITPLEFITRCQGTFPLWKGSVGSEGRCLRQVPTWRGRWAGDEEGWLVDWGKGVYVFLKGTERG